MSTLERPYGYLATPEEQFPDISPEQKTKYDNLEKKLKNKSLELEMNMSEEGGEEAYGNFFIEKNKLLAGLKEKYDNQFIKGGFYEDFLLYHLLLGDKSRAERPCTEFDFPEDDSIEAFINSL